MADMNWVSQSGYLTNNKLNRDYQKVAQPLFKFRQFTDIKGAFGKQQGETENWLRVANVGNYGKRVAETNTMPTTTQSYTWGTVTVKEFGNSIPYTFKLEALSEFDVKEIIKAGLMDDMVKVVDGTVERQFNATPLRYVGLTTTSGTVTTNSTAGGTNTSVLNSYHVRKMRLELEKLFAPTWDGEDYAGVLSLEAAESLEGAMESVSQYTEAGYKKILSGETGRVHGVRFVKDSFASRYNFDPDAGTATAVTWTGGYSGNGYIFGKQTVKEIVTVPEEVRLKVVTDFGRSKGMAWYFMGEWKIFWETYGAGQTRIIKWDSAA